MQRVANLLRRLADRFDPGPDKPNAGWPDLPPGAIGWSVYGGGELIEFIPRRRSRP